MSSFVIAASVFACVLAGALVGLFLRKIIPAHHLTSETKDTVKVAMGLVATTAALVLGLLVASAKDAYDAEKGAVTQMAAKVVFLDRVLDIYGPEAKPTRHYLRQAVLKVTANMWPDSAVRHAQLDPNEARAEALFISIQQLSPKSDLQTALKSQAAASAIELGQLRWLVYEQAGASVSAPLLMILTFWLSILFVSFGIFSPSNSTVMTALLFAALSVSGAVFLIAELSHPFDGAIQISSAPLENALAHLEK